MSVWGIFCLEFQNAFGTFAMEFEKNIVIFEISTLELEISQKNKNSQIMD